MPRSRRRSSSRLRIWARTRHVHRGDRLVADQDLRARGRGRVRWRPAAAGHPTACAGWRSARPARGRPARAARPTWRRSCRRPAGRAARNGSPPSAPTVRRGSNEACGSWNTSWTRRRSAALHRPVRAEEGPAVEQHVALVRPVEAHRRSARASSCRSPTRRPGPRSPPPRPTGRRHRPPGPTPLADRKSDGRPRARARSRAGLPARQHATRPPRRRRGPGSSPAVIDRERAARRERAADPARRGHPSGQLRQPRASRIRGRGANGSAAARSAIDVGMRRSAAMSSAAGRSSTMRPAYITAIRSATAAATARSWVTSSSATSSSATSPTSRSSICAWTVASSAVVGSSARITSGRAASAAAIAARWLQAARELMRVRVRAARGSPMPHRARSASVTARASRPRSPRWTSSTSSIWLPTVSTGLRLPPGSWNTMPMPRPRTRARSPLGQVEERPTRASRTSPSTTRRRGSRPAIASRIVLLPEPLSPDEGQRRAPARPTRSMPSTARTSGPCRSRERKRTRSPRTSSAGASEAPAHRSSRAPAAGARGGSPAHRRAG